MEFTNEESEVLKDTISNVIHWNHRRMESLKQTVERMNTPCDCKICTCNGDNNLKMYEHSIELIQKENQILKDINIKLRKNF